SLSPITRGMFGYSLLRSSQNKDYFNALFDKLKDFDVPLEGLHTETGPGVYEGAILYDEILEAADRGVLFKASVKEIAKEFGIHASFMGKWNADLPGCSGHLHQSLWDLSTNKNLFYDETKSSGMSQILEHYLAGILYCLPELLLFYAPNINS